MRKACLVVAAAFWLPLLGGCDTRPNSDLMGGNDTAEIEVASESSGPAPIDPAAITPYDRQADADIYRTWGSKAIPRLNAFRKAAAKAVAKNPECGHVSYVDLADEQHGSKAPDYPVMIVDCIPVKRFFVSEEDIKKSVHSQTEKGLIFTHNTAIKFCIDAVKSQMNYPSSMSIDPLSTTASQGVGTGNWGITIKFKAKNGLGNTVPQIGHCIITPEGNLETTIEAR